MLLQVSKDIGFLQLIGTVLQWCGKCWLPDILQLTVGELYRIVHMHFINHNPIHVDVTALSKLGTLIDHLAHILLTDSFVPSSLIRNVSTSPHRQGRAHTRTRIH